MSNGAWSFAGHDGILTGRTFSGPARDLAANTPAGCIAVPGRHDHMRRRLDITTGQLVPYQPPPPDDTEWQTWVWDAVTESWSPSPTNAAMARDIRAERNRRMQSCDWTQLPDVPANTAQAWSAYRQALRDITDQPTFPVSVTWPVEP